MNNLSLTNSSVPFSVSLVNQNGSSYDFIVNIGDINSFIYQTYKYGTKTYDARDIPSLDLLNFFDSADAPSANGKYSFAAQGNNGPTKEFGREWVKTFSTSESCSVYLVTHKIPIGFDFFSDYSISKSIWWYISQTDYINATHVEVSSEDGFSERYENNRKYTENKNIFQPDALVFGLLSRARPKEFSNKNDYFGKTYIKLADITIENGVVSLTHFFRSNIINPSRYIRMGTMNFKYMRIFVWTVADNFNETSLVQKIGEEMYNPEVFLKSISEIKENAQELADNFYSRFYSEYDENSSYTLPSLETDEEEKYKNLKVFRVAILYTKYANGKILFENVFEDVEILNERRRKYETVSEENLFEADLPMKKSEALEFLGVEEEDNFVELIGFAENDGD